MASNVKQHETVPHISNALYRYSETSLPHQIQQFQ